MVDGGVLEALPGPQFAALVGKTKEVAMDGRYELFKTSTTFDGTVKHPEWLGGDVDAVKKMASPACNGTGIMPGSSVGWRSVNGEKKFDL